MPEDSHQTVTTHASHLEVARHIDQRCETIIANWIELVNEKIEGARVVDEPALEDDVPEILELVGDALREGTASADTDFMPVRAHGEQRAALTHTSLRWVLEELHLLRSVVVEDTEDELGRLGREDLLLIYDVFDQVTTISTEAYVNWQLHKEEEARKQAEQSVEKLRKLTEMLEEERERRLLFVSAVVHDLRTPLASMQIATDLIENFSGRPGVRENAVDKLQRNVRRLDSMAQRLLDVNRITAGSRLPMDIEQLDLVALARGYVSDARSNYGDEAVRIDTPEDTTELEGWWNREALLRILSNLVENGLKYGEPPVTVRLRPLSADQSDDQSDDKLRLQVHDEGPPIPPEDQKRIFEQFVRLEDAQQKHKSGWGIGLTLVRGLARGLGGHLELDSGESGGTTFTVELPRDARPFQDDEQVQNDEQA